MQYSAALNLALAAAGLFSTASGLVSMQVRYTDNMVNGMYQTVLRFRAG